MFHSNTAVLMAAAALATTAVAATGQQTSGNQSASTKSQAQAQEVTLTGCVRQASDDARLFALVAAGDRKSTAATEARSRSGEKGEKKDQKEEQKKGEKQAVGTTGSRAEAPLYRLQDRGQNLKTHVGHRVQITGNVTRPKDEKGADIVVGRAENIGVDTVTITSIDLKPAPILDVTSVRRIGGDCPSQQAAEDKQAGSGAGRQDERMAGTSGTATETTAGTTGTGETTRPAGTSGGAAPTAVSVGAISENPDRFINQTVKVTGEVERVFNPQVFSLDEDRVFSAGGDVLVLTKQRGVANDDEHVTVTGKVRRFVRTEFQREIVDFDLRPEWLVDFESRPVIIATDVSMESKESK